MMSNAPKSKMEGAESVGSVWQPNSAEQENVYICFCCCLRNDDTSSVLLGRLMGKDEGSMEVKLLCIPLQPRNRMVEKHGECILPLPRASSPSSSASFSKMHQLTSTTPRSVNRSLQRIQFQLSQLKRKFIAQHHVIPCHFPAQLCTVRFLITG